MLRVLGVRFMIVTKMAVRMRVFANAGVRA
jgi:hypothetical protein